MKEIPHAPWEGAPAPPKANCSEETRRAYERHVEDRFFEAISKQLPDWVTPDMSDRSLEHRKALAARWAIDFMEYYGKVGHMVGKKRMTNVNIAISGWTRRNIDDRKHLKRIAPSGSHTTGNAGHDSRNTRSATIPTADDARRISRIVG